MENEPKLPFEFDPGKIDLGDQDVDGAVFISEELITGLREDNTVAEVTRIISDTDNKELGRFTMLRRLVPVDTSLN